MKPWARISCAAALLCAWISAMSAEPTIRSIDVMTPRAFGYVIGDTFTHTVRLEISKPYRLDDASLPSAGRLNRWLELREPALRVNGGWGYTSYELTLTYQIFNVDNDLASVATPRHELSVTDGQRALPVIVAPWSFSVSPLTRHETLFDAYGLRPDYRPSPIPVWPHITRLGLMTMGLIASLGVLAYLHWGLPWLARANRPFSHACKSLKKLEHKPFNARLYREALQHAHAAFNQTAGNALFAENLDGFFQRHPEFSDLRERIEALFQQSREIFFGPNEAIPRDVDTLADLMELCGACRDRERGLA